PSVRVTQGDGGATDEWHDHLYPDMKYVDPGLSVSWITTVKGGGGCSGYEHCTVTDNDNLPSGWSSRIKMHAIRSGNFHYIEPGNPSVNVNDDIEDREFYIGSYWDYDIIYTINSPLTAPGGQQAQMICTVNVVGYSPENQHDWVYVHCTAAINAPKPPWCIVTYPNYGDIVSGTFYITWDIGPQSGLSYEIYLSDDGGWTYPHTIDLSVGDVTSYEWDSTAYPDGLEYRLKFIVWDGAALGYCYSEGVFTIDNVAPEPPPNLDIQFGLTTHAEPTAKGTTTPFDDTTGNDLRRLKEDDGRGYGVIKGGKLSIDTFNVTTQTDPVESATLYVEYFVNASGYSGINTIWWKLETDPGWNDTGIQPLPTELSPVIATFDLKNAGVDTIDKIANLDIFFLNDDDDKSQSVIFDYMWIEIEASSNDLGLTWDASPAADINHYHIYKSTDNSIFSPVGEVYCTWWNDPGTAAPTDTNNYFYRVRGVDHGDAEGLPDYTVAKYITSLSDGWNMASTPLAPVGDASRSTVLFSITGNYDAIQTCQGGASRSWQDWRDSKPSRLNTLTDISHKKGYYLRMQGTHDLVSLGRVPESPSIDLVTGWNIIGYPNLDTQLRDTALVSIDTKYDAVYRYDPVTDNEVEVTVSDSLEPGYSYWIHVTEDCSLTL
ncbi:MAG: hypothetical protein JSW28_04800, partial [Thermoplasmata archaeon]